MFVQPPSTPEPLSAAGTASIRWTVFGGSTGSSRDLLEGRGFGVFERSITSACCNDPSRPRAATDHRPLEAANKDRLDPLVDPEAVHAEKPSPIAVGTSGSSDSDSFMACCKSLTNVGDSSRAS